VHVVLGGIPDVVLGIDSHGVSVYKAVEALADLAEVVPVLVELEEARPLAARVNEDVPLGIGGDADTLAEVEIGRQLKKLGTDS
jgi:hypothetical protein